VSITKYEGITVSKQALVIEECCFINCVLKECHLFYSGGDVEMTNCQMEVCVWHFRGPALKTIQMMQGIGMLTPAQTPAQFHVSKSKMN
jgi:hypothetical protein